MESECEVSGKVQPGPVLWGCSLAVPGGGGGGVEGCQNVLEEEVEMVSNHLIITISVAETRITLLGIRHFLLLLLLILKLESPYRKSGIRKKQCSPQVCHLHTATIAISASTLPVKNDKNPHPYVYVAAIIWLDNTYPILNSHLWHCMISTFLWPYDNLSFLLR